jgi:signal transduction histidine kinase
MPVRALYVLTWISITVILVLDYFVYSAHTVPILYAVLVLLADIAHERRTPLTVVLGYTERLEADPRLPDPLHRTVVTVKVAAQRMRRAIDTIVERGKAEGGAST